MNKYRCLLIFFFVVVNVFSQQQVDATNDEIANASPGDFIIRTNGEKVILSQADIEYAKRQLELNIKLENESDGQIQTSNKNIFPINPKIIIISAIILILMILFISNKRKNKQIETIELIISNAKRRNRNQENLYQLKKKYLTSLHGKDKQYALNVSREYIIWEQIYKHGNYGYKLSLLDEQKIANEISAMNINYENDKINNELYNVVLLGWAEENRLDVLKLVAKIKNIEDIRQANYYLFNVPSILEENLSIENANKLNLLVESVGGIAVVK